MLKQFLAFCLPLLGCQTSFDLPQSYEARLVNHQDQPLLFLVQDTVRNSRGQALGYYEQQQCYNQRGQILARIQGAEIFNAQGGVIASVSGERLLNAQGNEIMQVEGNTVEDRAKIGAGFFFFLSTP